MNTCDYTHSRGYDYTCDYEPLCLHTHNTDVEPLYYISGYHSDGSPMRPSDWPYMLSGRFARMRGGAIDYTNSPIRPMWHNNRLGVAIYEDVDGVGDLLKFANDNDLMVYHGG